MSGFAQTSKEDARTQTVTIYSMRLSVTGRIHIYKRLQGTATTISYTDILGWSNLYKHELHSGI